MIALIHLWLASYGRAALILGLGVLLGYPAGRRYLRGAAAAPLTVLLGLALMSLIICLLSWAHWFAGWSVIAVATVGFAASAFNVSRDLSRWRTSWRARRRPEPAVLLGFGLLLAALAFFSVLALYPVNGFDATSYHLPLARDLVRHHGFSYDPYVRYSFFPQAGESIFAVMLMLSRNPVRCAALEYSVLAVTALLLPCWFISARRGLGAGFAGAIVLLASPDVIFCGTTAYVDTWTMGFVLAALLVGLDGATQPERRRSSLALMGVFIGEAASTKYTGLLFGVLGGVGVLIATGRSPLALWRELAGAIAFFCVIALPWYAWTIHTAGDPFYPFAIGLFGGKSLWTPSEVAFQNLVARATARSGFSSILHQDLRYLSGATPYDTGVHRSPLSWLLGGGVLGLLIPAARRDRAFIGTLAAGVLSIAASLQLSADPRYTIPAVGPLAVAAGMTAGHAWRLVQRWRPAVRWRELLVPVTLLASTILGLWTSIAFARDDVYDGGSPPITGQQVDSYVAARVPCFPAVEWLNHDLGSHYRAWAYVCEETRYYAQGLLISDTFSTGSRIRVFDNNGNTLPPAAVLWRRLAPLRVSWMILPAGTPANPATLDSGHLFQLAATAGPNDIYRIEP